MTSSQTRSVPRSSKAVIVLKSGVEGTEGSEIQQMVRQRLLYAYPREIEFITARPKTPIGKIQRFILRGGA
jgi:acyl-coenzyme A synthetase/AMP-(fatty) acid ligase